MKSFSPQEVTHLTALWNEEMAHFEKVIIIILTVLDDDASRCQKKDSLLFSLRSDRHFQNGNPDLVGL